MEEYRRLMQRGDIKSYRILFIVILKLFKCFLMFYTAAALNNGMYDNLHCFRQTVENAYAWMPQTTDHTLRRPEMQQRLNVLRRALSEEEKQKRIRNRSR